MILLLQPLDPFIRPAVKSVNPFSLPLGSWGGILPHLLLLSGYKSRRRRAYVFGALLDEESRNLLFPPVVANYGSGG